MASLRYRQIFRIINPTKSFIVKRNSAIQSTAENVSTKMNLEERVAVITGAASGIGYALAKEFLKEGMAAITLIDKDKESLDECFKSLAADFGEEKILQLEADVGDASQMDLAFKNTVLHYQTIDIIVNNAGIMDDTHWEAQLKTNLQGCIIGTLLGMQYMAKSSAGEGGIIVNIGSIMSLIPSCGFPIYTMTQFGIAGFTRALGSSNLYKRTGVKIFGYCPSLTDTKLMKDVSSKSINLNFASEFQEEIQNCTVQKPEIVAKGLVDILEEAKPGSIWVSENNSDLYEVKFPEIVRKQARAENQSR